MWACTVCTKQNSYMPSEYLSSLWTDINQILNIVYSDQPKLWECVRTHVHRLNIKSIAHVSIKCAELCTAHAYQRWHTIQRLIVEYSGNSYVKEHSNHLRKALSK